jgi:DNA polymerase I-like protein with 3'-5' exonuclease and polymerase domains
LRPYTVVNDEHLLAGIAREIESADVIGLDLETAKIGGGGSFDPLTGRVRLCSVNTGQGLYIIDLYKTKTLGPVVDAFRRTKGVTVGQNMKFDQKWLLWHFDLEIGKLFDTFRASSIIYAGLPGLKHDLWSLYKRELGEAATVEDLGGSDWDGTLTQRQLDYAADDIDKLPRLRDVLKKKIVDARLVKIAQLEFNAVLPEACMELNGFFLNKDMWLTRTASDRVQLERLRASLLSKLPNPSNQLGLFGPASFNLDSTDQILRSFHMLGVKQKWKDPETGLTKTVPLMDTKEMTLAMEADRWPILKEFIEYRGYAQSVKAFGEEYLKNIHPTSGRIHSSYFPFTDTGRYACVAPWTPVRTREGAKPILDVRVGDEVWTHKERWRRVLAFLPQGSLQTYAVTFSTGDILTCSASHRLLLSDGNWRTVGEMFHERFQDLGAEHGKSAGSTEPLPQPRNPKAGGHCEDTGDDRTQCPSGGAALLARSRAQGTCSGALLGLEGGRAEPDARQDERGASQLDRRVRRRSRLPDMPVEREETICPPHCDDGVFGTVDPTRRDGRASHRREPEEQLSGQSCAGHRARAPGYSLFAGEGQHVVAVEEINLAGRLEVYDLTVEDDESYDTYGVFSHNCRGPNLQQVPRGGAFRDCFRAEPGRTLAVADWSNIEMRIVAEISKDPVLIKVFRDDRDAHYATASLVTGKPESEIQKAERQQAKPVNFGFCIAEGQRVLTQDGLIPIESVRDWHVVWDGVEWVTHDGLIDRGMQPVQTYDGLTTTPDHEVFTDDGHRISMREAASPLRPRRIAVGAIGLDPVGYTAFDRQGRTAASQPEVRRGHLRPLHPNPLDSGRQHTGAEDDQLHLPREVQRSPIRDLGRALRLYGAALSSGYARLVAQLQGTRDSGLVPVEGAVHSLGSGELPGLQLQGAGLRPNGQQRALRAIEPSAGDALGKLEEPLPLARVYDLLNAGPRHRFTVEGKVVSNCYGMQAARMVLYAKQGYGVNMTEATARTFRRKFFEAYAGIDSWHRLAMDSGKRQRETRTAWGRRRIIKDEKAHNEFYNCLDADTEALTARGWVKGFDLAPDDVLLTKNLETDALEWQGMLDLKLWPDYEGPLVEFRSKSFHAVSTPEHRWLVTNKATGRNECRTTANLSQHGDHRIHRTGRCLTAGVGLYTDDFVDLCGWFLTDGTGIFAPRKRTPPKAVVRLFQSARANPTKVAEIDALLVRMGVRYGRYFYAKHGEIVTWQLEKDTSALLLQLFPERVLTSSFLQSLTGEQARQIVKTMLRGDGTTDATNGKQSFCSRSEYAAGMFQVLLTLAGKASSLHAHDYSGLSPPPLSAKMKNRPRRGRYWTVNILRRDKVQVTAAQRTEYVARQPVWCPVVPNSYFVARRSGHVFITGNSPIQGTGADGLKVAIRNVYDRLKKLAGRTPLLGKGAKCAPVHMVHDEIVCEHDDDPELEIHVRQELHDGMIEGIAPMLPSVPTRAEVGGGRSWASKS